MSDKFSDERIVKKTDFSQTESRKDRASADNERHTDEAIAAKIASLRSDWSDNIFPDIEGDPTYHYCWLSTTNQLDPIYRRLRLGYELVKHDELKYLGSQNRVQSGEFEGCVSINEMLLAKIPVPLYQELMSIAHYEKPMQEEDLLRANMAKSEFDSDGRPLGKIFGDGIENLGQRVRRPIFE